MAFQDKKGEINWKVHFSSPMEKVHSALTTDEGRKTFWAEQTIDKDGCIEFTFLNYPKCVSKILAKNGSDFFAIEYLEQKLNFNLLQRRMTTEPTLF